MNEITKIHLGRQPFTISVDAHKALEEYLHAISRRVGSKGKDVVDEVELRIAELLMERGVKEDKVALISDVNYIKDQLGKPGDFSDEEGGVADDEGKEKEESGSKRLFRDPEHGIIAGVAAGLAAYFKIDAVFVRIGFVALTLLWGWGIALYIILWLITPELKTKSDRLRSQGKAITVDSLKSLVERADVPGATGRVVKAIQTVVRSGWRALVILLSIVFVVAGAAGLLGITTLGSYLLLGSDQGSLEGIFLVNGKEVLAVVLALLAAGIVCMTLLLIGIAEVKRRQVIPGWIAAVMLGVFLISLSVGVALTPGIVQDVRSRYEAAHHTIHRSVEPFTALHVLANSQMTQVAFEPSSQYYVDIAYFGDADPQLITSTVADGYLTVNPDKFIEATRCRSICLYDDPFVKITVYAPQVDRVEVDRGGVLLMTEPLKQSSLELLLTKGAHAHLNNIHAGKVEWTSLPDRSEDRLMLSNLLQDAIEDDFITATDMLVVNRTSELVVTVAGACEMYYAKAHIMQAADRVVVNGQLFASLEGLRAEQRAGTSSLANCVTLDNPGVGVDNS